MGRHRMQTATPSEDDESEGTRQLPLLEIVHQRRKTVFGAAAGIVSVLALGGVVTLARGFAPAEADGCAPACVTEQTADTGAAEPSASSHAPTRSAHPAHTSRDSGRTFAPTVVRQEKRTPPRATPTPSMPSFPTEFPRPPWRDHDPWHHWPGRG